MQQISPLDMTSVLSTDVSALRTGLLTVKGYLQPLLDFKEKVSQEELLEGMEKAVQTIQDVLVKQKEADATASANS